MTKTIDLISNKLRLEAVKDSPYWRMRWKNPDGAWRAKSTKIELDHPSYFPKHKTSRTSAVDAIDRAERGKPSRPYPSHIISELAVLFDRLGVNGFRINVSLKCYDHYQVILFVRC